MALLVRRGRGVLHDAGVAGVERRDEALDGAALPRGVPALEQHQQAGPDPHLPDLAAQSEAQLAQARPERRERLLLLGRRQPLGQIDIVQAPHAAHASMSTAPAHAGARAAGSPAAHVAGQTCAKLPFPSPRGPRAPLGAS